MAQLEKEFSRRQPDAGLTVEYLRPEKVYSAVLADEADLGLVSYRRTQPRNHRIPWRQEEMVWSRPPRIIPWRDATSVNPADLNGLDFIGFDEDLPIRREVDRFLKRERN